MPQLVSVQMQGLSNLDQLHLSEFYGQRQEQPVCTRFPVLATTIYPTFSQHDICFTISCKSSKMQSSVPPQLTY